MLFIGQTGSQSVHKAALTWLVAWTDQLINPRRACAARPVTVVILCVCVFVFSILPSRRATRGIHGHSAGNVE